MSSHFHFTMNFQTRRDMPAPVAAAIAALSNGQQPDQTDLAALPELIAEYLGGKANQGDVDAGGGAWRFTPINLYSRAEKPDDPTHLLHMERVFHDDEYFNAGVFFVFWLFQFACDGHLAVELTSDSLAPTLFARHGDNILITTLAYDPDEFATPATQRPRPKHPIIVSDSQRQQLAPMVKLAEEWNPDILFG